MRQVIGEGWRLQAADGYLLAVKRPSGRGFYADSMRFVRKLPKRLAKDVIVMACFERRPGEQ